ncbi:MAG: TraA family conjugative transfer protein [Acidobacteriaceae bacterium]
MDVALKRVDRALRSDAAIMGAVIAISLVASITLAHAGAGGANEFGQLGQRIISWAQGWLGIIIAIVALLVGLSMGAVKQTLLPVVVAIGIAIALYYGVNVITGIIAPVAGYGVVHPLVAHAHAVLGAVNVR